MIKIDFSLGCVLISLKVPIPNVDSATFPFFPQTSQALKPSRGWFPVDVSKLVSSIFRPETDADRP